MRSLKRFVGLNKVVDQVGSIAAVAAAVMLETAVFVAWIVLYFLSRQVGVAR
jgi:hypothetical protein